MGSHEEQDVEEPEEDILPNPDTDPAEGDTNGTNQVTKSSRHRPRKRRLYSLICKQMEFYFSDANITKNRLMQEMVTSSSHVSITHFLDFNRIKSLTSKPEDIQRALATSDKLELSPDLSGVRRKVPFDFKKVKSDLEVEECTIYVENVPRHVDHAWLETIFLTFGPIAYISLPKFRKSNQPKGFAFIEFENKEIAQGCIEAYKGEGACLPSDMNPGELLSIQSFSEEQGKNTPHSGNAKSPENQRKRKLQKSPGSSPSDLVEEKKFKPEPEVQNSPDTNTHPDESTNEIPDETHEIQTDDDENEYAHSNSTTIRNPNPNEIQSFQSPRKKKQRKKNKLKKTAEEKLEGDSIHLKVMPKKAWRQLRNRYLNLQRQNMSKLKKQLRDQNLRQQHYRNCYAPVEPIIEQGRSNIIELYLDSPAESAEAFKRQIKVDLAGESEEEAAISGFVEYVDYEEGAVHAFVRFGKDECFLKRILAFVGNAEKVFKSARVLTVQESIDYKAQVQASLKQKRKLQPRKNVRGKDRLLKAAAKSHHIRFDMEDEEFQDQMEMDGNNEVELDQSEFKDEIETQNRNYSPEDNEPESTTA